MPAVRAERGRAGRALLFLLTAALVLVLLWQWLAPPPPPTPEAGTGDRGTPVLRQIEWRVQDGRRVSGPDRVEARVGEHLRLQVRSDRTDELHIHGYEMRQDLAAGQTQGVDLPLTRSGRFEVELHRTHLPLTVLEVQPR